MTSTTAAPINGAKKNGNPVAPVNGTTNNKTTSDSVIAPSVTQEERIGKHAVHRLASLFPLLVGEEYQALVERVRVSGQNLPIVLDQRGVVVDGRNRLRACLDLGIEPKFETRVFENEADLSLYLISANLTRRHLKTIQRAFLAAILQETLRPQALENATRGGAAKNGGGDTRDVAGALVGGVSHTNVDKARKAIKADPRIAGLVNDGKLTTMKEVEQLAKSDPEHRTEAIERLKKAPATSSKKKTSRKKSSGKKTSSKKSSGKAQPSKASSNATQQKTEPDILGALEMVADFLSSAEQSAFDKFAKSVSKSSKLTDYALETLIEALHELRDASATMRKPKQKRKSTSRAARLADAMEQLNGPEIEKAKDAAEAYLAALDGKSEWQGDPPALDCGKQNKMLEEVSGVVEDMYEQTNSQVSSMEGTNFENAPKYEDLQGSLEGLEALKDALEGLDVPEIPSDSNDRDAWKTYADALSRLYGGIQDAVSAADDICFP